MNEGFNADDKRWRSGVFRPGNLRLIAIFITTVFLGFVGIMMLFKRQDLFQPPLRWENLLVLIPVLSLLTLFCFLKGFFRCLFWE